jgi:transcriptional regulator with XRE-family HTH domain
VAKSTVRILNEFRVGIRGVMEDAGITQTDLAQKAHVERHWVNQVLLGRRGVRVHRAMLESVQSTMLSLVAVHNDAESLREKLESIFSKQLGYQEKTAENWTPVAAMQMATELLSGMVDDGLTKEQMEEVASFLCPLISAMRGGKSD